MELVTYKRISCILAVFLKIHHHDDYARAERTMQNRQQFAMAAKTALHCLTSQQLEL